MLIVFCILNLDKIGWKQTEIGMYVFYNYSCVSNKRGVSNKHPVWDFALKKNKRPVLNKCPVLNSTQKIISVLYLINVLAR